MGLSSKTKKRLHRLFRKHKLALSRASGAAILIAAVIGGVSMIHHEPLAIEYRMEGVSIDWLPSSVSKRKVEIDNQASRYDIDADMVAIIMTLESGGYDKADSGQAEGLMQVTPETARDIAAKHLITPTKSYNLFDPETSIEFGVSYLAYLRNTFCGRLGEVSSDKCVAMIAAGYNGGPGAANVVFQDQPLQIDQTSIYARNARRLWQERHQPTSPTYQRWLQAGGQTLVDKAEAA